MGIYFLEGPEEHIDYLVKKNKPYYCSDYGAIFTEDAIFLLSVNNKKDFVDRRKEITIDSLKKIIEPEFFEEIKELVSYYHKADYSGYKYNIYNLYLIFTAYLEMEGALNADMDLVNLF